jgi:hypothetical protein
MIFLCCVACTKHIEKFAVLIGTGVEISRERDGREIRTREVPEDDVPSEYLDEG